MLFGEGPKMVPGWVLPLLAFIGLWVWSTRRRNQGLSPLADAYVWPLIGVVCLGLSILLYLWLGHVDGRSAVAARWPSVLGVVEFAELRMRYGTRPGGAFGMSGSGSAGDVEVGTTRLRIGVDQPSDPSFTIRYRYRVEGNEYEGNQVTAGHFRTEGADREWARRYPKGKSVRVYYNPTHPSEAVLEPQLLASGHRRTPWLFSLFGLGFCVLGWWDQRSGMGRSEAVLSEE